MAETDISVGCLPETDGWRCTVRVSDDAGASEHEVRVDRQALQSLAPQGTEPEDLVRRSFEFLLEHEPRGAIMRRFELPIISRFFADYEDEIRRRMLTSSAQSEES
jgi:hypothetical protein